MQNWASALAAFVRDSALSQDWLGFAHEFIRSAPEWALLIGVPIAAIGILLPALIGAKSSWQAISWAWELAIAALKHLAVAHARAEIEAAFQRGLEQGSKREGEAKNNSEDHIRKLALRGLLDEDEMKAHKKKEFESAGYVVVREGAAR